MKGNYDHKLINKTKATKAQAVFDLERKIEKEIKMGIRVQRIKQEQEELQEKKRRQEEKIKKNIETMQKDFLMPKTKKLAPAMPKP